MQSAWWSCLLRCDYMSVVRLCCVVRFICLELELMNQLAGVLAVLDDYMLTGAWPSCSFAGIVVFSFVLR